MRTPLERADDRRKDRYNSNIFKMFETYLLDEHNEIVSDFPPYSSDQMTMDTMRAESKLSRSSYNTKFKPQHTNIDIDTYDMLNTLPVMDQALQKRLEVEFKTEKLKTLDVPKIPWSALLDMHSIMQFLGFYFVFDRVLPSILFWCVVLYFIYIYYR